MKTEILNVIDKTKEIAKGPKYVHFFQEDFDKLIEEYRNNKKWDSDIDILPTFWADVLNISIIVIVIQNETISYSACLNYEAFNKETCRAVVLRAGHYWKLNCKFKRLKKDNKNYVKPTIVIPYIDSRTNEDIQKVFKRYAINSNIDSRLPPSIT